jgi:hypothetical protein
MQLTTAMITVPIELIPQIAELVDQHGDETATANPGSSAPSPTEQGAPSSELINDWTVPLLRRAYREHPANMRRVWDCLAAHADEYVSYRTIGDEVGMDAGSVSRSFGPFTRRMQHRYKLEHWPLDWRRNDDGVFQLRMPAAVAEVIKQVAAE